MKKYTLVSFAILLAFAVSAFTNKKTDTTYWIHPGTEWLPISDQEACPAGSMSPCSADNPYTEGVNDPTPVYITQSLSNPLKKPS